MQLVDDILQVISSRVYKAGFYMVDHSNLRSNEGANRITKTCDHDVQIALKRR